MLVIIRYTHRLISNYLDIYMKDALKRIHGVADEVPGPPSAKGQATNAWRAQQNVQVAA